MMKLIPTEATMSAITRVATLIPVVPNARRIGPATHRVKAIKPVVSADAPISGTLSIA